MKIYYVFLCYCLFAAASPLTGLGAGVLHTFTTPDGRSLNAVIKDYNPSTKKIQIKREDGKELWTLPTVFSEPDQEYVQQWIAADQFMSPTKFKITGKKTKHKISKNKTEIVYEITLENKTAFPLKDLKIEYRAFILNKGYEGKRDSNRVGGGALEIAEIPAGQKMSQKADPIHLSTQFKTVSESSSNGGYSSYEKKTDQEHLKGFWIKVYGPKVDGISSIREWCNPSDTLENFAWRDKVSLPQQEAVSGPNLNNKENNLIREAGQLWKSDPEKALELAKEAYEIRQSQRAACAIGRTYLHFLKPANIPLGLEWLEKAADGNDYHACWLLARTYSTHIDPQYHNAKKGIQYGLQAVSINSKKYEGHDKLAEAYALDGQFNKAIEQQKIANKIYAKTGSAKGIAIMEQAIERYRNHKPCPPY